MVIKGYENIDTWIFDLDHTLYPAPSLWEKRAFSYFFEYIEKQYGISKAQAQALDEKFSDNSFYLKGWLEHVPAFDVHHWWQEIDAIDISDIPVCQLTQKKLKELPGKKVLFTNGHPSHADKMLNHLGLSCHFDDVIAIDLEDIKRERFKPNPSIYHEIITKMKTKAERCVMFEDNIANLKTAHEMGMGTILVNQTKCQRHLDYIHNQKDTFTHWLQEYMPQ